MKRQAPRVDAAQPASSGCSDWQPSRGGCGGDTLATILGSCGAFCCNCLVSCVHDLGPEREAQGVVGRSMRWLQHQSRQALAVWSSLSDQTAWERLRSRALSCSDRADGCIFPLSATSHGALTDGPDARANSTTTAGEGRAAGRLCSVGFGFSEMPSRCWGGYLRTVRPALKRGWLVIGDRWMYGYLVQPAALKFHGPDLLARAVVRLLPRPHLVVNLSAPSQLIRMRKQELTASQLEQELLAWSSLPFPNVQTVDATRSPQVIAAEILARVCTTTPTSPVQHIGHPSTVQLSNNPRFHRDDGFES